MARENRKMEREMRDLKEEVENCKIRLKLEKERRESLERKVQEQREKMEVMKAKMRNWQKEMDEAKETRKEVEKRKQQVKGGRRLGEINENKNRKEGRRDRLEKQRGVNRCMVWDRGLIVHLNNWKEEDSLKEWMEDIMEGVDWEIENTRTEDTKKVIFKRKEDMEKIWEKRAEIKEGGKIRMEQWLTHEERRAKALIMRELRKKEEEEKEGEKKCLKEAIIAEVEGLRYEWDEEREWIVRKGKRARHHAEENGYKRWRFEDSAGEEEE